MGDKIKRYIKNSVIFTSYVLGLGHLIHYLNRGKVTLLSIHSIMSNSTPTTWQPVRAQLDPAVLDRNLAILGKYYQFVSFSEAIDGLNGKTPLSGNSLAVTMDDGYANNITHGLPVFSKHGVKPIIFAATGHVEQQRCFWFDRIDYALQQVSSATIIVPFDNNPYTFFTDNPINLKRSYAAFRKHCEYYFPNDESMQEALNDIANFIENDSHMALSQLQYDAWSSIATWSQLQQAYQQNTLEVGSHTVGHVRISRVQANIALQELLQSKQSIEDKIGTCYYFCYPNGDYDETSEKLVKQAGYLAAVTVNTGINKAGDDLFRLKRLSFPEQQYEYQIVYNLIIRPYFAQLKQRLFNN